MNVNTLWYHEGRKLCDQFVGSWGGDRNFWVVHGMYGAFFERIFVGIKEAPL